MSSQKSYSAPGGSQKDQTSVTLSPDRILNQCVLFNITKYVITCPCKYVPTLYLYCIHYTYSLCIMFFTGCMSPNMYTLHKMIIICNSLHNMIILWSLTCVKTFLVEFIYSGLSNDKLYVPKSFHHNYHYSVGISKIIDKGISILF